MRCAAADDSHTLHLGRQPVDGVRAQLGHGFHRLGHFCTADLCRDAEGGDLRRGFRAGTNAALLPAAVDVGRQLQPAADVERADALRRMDLVTADGDEVRAERFGRKRHLQKALHRVRVQQRNAVFCFQHPGDGGNVVDCTCLIVDHHE